MRKIILGLLLFASVALADTTVGSLEPTNGTWRAYRGTGFSTLVCSANSEAAALACAAADAERRASTTRYQIRYPNRYATVTYRAPTPTCPALPATETRTATCPTGTTGTYPQTRSYTAAPYPTCSTAGAWTPVDPPAGACVTPSPVLLPAPTNVSTQGISTSAIRVTWGAVTDAAAYSLERCIGATCTTFSQLLCVTGLTGTHSGLPANLTARYRIRASRDATCGTAAGNLGTYSTIVNGTTLGSTPPSPTGTATLSWTPPTANTDGTSLSNLAGFRISYSASPTELVNTIQVPGPGISTYTVSELASGTYYFSVRAYTSNGTESVQSNTVSKAVP